MRIPAPPISRAVLLSNDVAFHDKAERALSLLVTDGHALSLSRAHPSGGLQTLRALLGSSDGRTVLLLDYRERMDKNVRKLISDWFAAGGRGCCLAEGQAAFEKILATGDALAVPFCASSIAWVPEELAGFLRILFPVPEPAGANAWHRARLTAADEKSRVSEALIGALRGAGLQRTQMSRVLAVADELLMNGLYDAAAASPRSVHYQQLKRDASWRLDTGDWVEFAWRFGAGDEGGDNTIVLSVTDSYGTLKPESIRKKISEWLSESQVGITHTGAAGGGVGFFMILRAARRVRFSVLPGKRCRVSVELDIAVGKGPRGRDPNRVTKRDKDVRVSFGLEEAGEREG